MNTEVLLNRLLDAAADLGLRLLAAALLLAVGLKFCGWVQKLVRSSVFMEKQDPSLHSFVASFTRIALYGLLAFMVAEVLGIETSSLLALLASAGVAIGLALQGALSNFAGGLMLLIFKPFKVGDYIEASGQGGTVRAVSVFYTYLDTPDNKTVTLPNGTLTGTAVVNYSANPTRRLFQTYLAGYDAPMDQVLGILQRVADSHPMVLQDPPPQIRLERYGERGLEYTLRVWCNTPDYWPLNFDLLEQVKREFEAAGIEIPAPRMDLYNR